MPLLITLIHAFLGLNAICAGMAVCIRMLLGRPFDKWAVHFLKCSLAASALGIASSLDRTELTQWITALAVYIAGISILARHKSEVSAAWNRAFVVSTMCVFCLNALVVLIHFLKFLHALNVPAPPQPVFLIPISMSILVTLFAVLSVIAVRKIQCAATGSMMHKVTR